MRCTRAVWLLAAWLLAGPSAWAQDKPVMTWLMQELPPVSMPVNGQPTIGTTDVLLKLIAQQWPQVHHHYVQTNTARALAMLAEGQEACFSGSVITPERERIAYITPTHFGIPLQLITRKAVLSRLPRNNAGEVLPANLFDSTQLRGLLVRNRSYSPVLDALINLRGPGATIDYAVMADGGANIFKMIALQRADYALEYDFALAYQLHREPDFYRDKGLIAVPIAGASPFVSGIACPRTQWGREMILKIDAIVASLASSPAYQQAGDRWLTASTIAHYKQARAAFFQNRTHPTSPQKFD